MINFISLNKFIRLSVLNLILLSLLHATLFTFGLLLIPNQSASAQDRRPNQGVDERKPRAHEDNPERLLEEDLERLLQSTERAQTIADIPAAFAKAIKIEYKGSPEIQRETKFEAYLASRYFWTMETIALQSKYQIQPGVSIASMCADGKCDGPLSTSVWSGAWTGGSAGSISDANLPIAAWTPGIIPNNNSIPDNANCTSHNLQAHHSIVPNGIDPVIPSIKTVAPTPATGNLASLRLGNRCPNEGGERVSKTFTVVPGQTNLQFWYASVFEDPGHLPSQQPGFGAYLLNGSTPVSNRIDLDPSTAGNQEFIVASQSPFFGKAPNLQVVYRDWTCVTIDLSGLEGQTLTLLLANRDCTLGAHWGYTYIDSLCLGCAGNPTGDVTFNPARSDCDKGEICFDFTVPKLPDGTTGQVTITFELYQNGALVDTITSGTFTANGTYCFTNFASSLNPSIPGYDWRATANFTVTGATISPMILGQRGEGFVPGNNNDCPTPPIDPCCPPWNKVRLADSMFYQGSGSISDPFTLHFQPSTTLKSQMQAYIDYLHVVNPAINTIIIDWRLHNQGTAALPIVPYGPQIGPTAFTSWNASTGPSGNPIVSHPNFFNLPIPFPMQIGTWYMVHTGIFLNDNQRFFPLNCSQSEILVRLQVLTLNSNAPVLEISDGESIIKQIPISRAMN